MALTHWTEPSELDDFLGRRASGVVFKHSTRCPISAGARRELERFLAEEPDLPGYLVLVIESRPLSAAVAEKLAVPHASPQAILVRDGVPVWNATHHAITAAALRRACAAEAVRQDGRAGVHGR